MLPSIEIDENNPYGPFSLHRTGQQAYSDPLVIFEDEDKEKKLFVVMSDDGSTSIGMAL